ncbi:thymidylate synthase [Methylobacterium sp. WL120]|nr:thymidylate synthase [Methylobacterium sp. WL120]
MIADSISPSGKRMRTIKMRLPRIILAELNTHRQLSKNTRSSRAVPVETMIKEVMEEPFIPLHWGAAQKGMQAYNETSERVDVGPVFGFPHEFPVENEKAWLIGRDLMVKLAEGFHQAGYAKQIINRLLEPWMFVDSLVSGTEWANFLALRDHHAAEPHIQVVAREVRRVSDYSTPYEVKPGEWHLPYVKDFERNLYPLDVLKKLSVARCARISYAPFDGNGSVEKEIERYDLLVGSAPIHASPTEHQATPDDTFTIRSIGSVQWLRPREHGNLIGWRQLRKLLPNECILEAA